MSDSKKTIDRWWRLVGCVAVMMAIANMKYAWTPALLVVDPPRGPLPAGGGP